MKLYLIRHGEADNASPDAERRLTDKGREDVRVTAEHLETQGVQVDLLIHSPLVRARETFELVQERVAPSKVECSDGLKPESPVNLVKSKIEELVFSDQIESLMLVGHLPFLADLVSALSMSAGVTFKTSTVVTMTADPRAHWRVQSVFHANQPV